jgi:DNA-binding CsgD family transcriptional regulator
MSGASATGPLLERSEELAQIESVLAEARGGSGKFLVIEGPAGIGKTALLSAARDAAGEAGMRVLRSRGTELEGEFAFGVVRQLFEPQLAEASEAERAELLHDAAGEAAALLGLPGGRHVDAGRSTAIDPSFAILHGLYWLCANLATREPVCVLVDDAHWADTPSLRYLAFLVTRLDELEVALVLATRPREPGTDADLLATLTGDQSAEVIALRGLTSAAVAQLVESRLGGSPEPRFVETCLRATQGTPFLLGQLLDALCEEGIDPTEAAADEVERIATRTVGRSLGLRLRRLPAHAGRLSRALAVLEQSDLLYAARLADLDDAEAAEAAELLAASGILDSGRPLRFVHPIVRSGIYNQLTGAQRAEGHRRAARLLVESPDARGRVAEHLLLAEPAADDWVVQRLVEAAHAATRSGAPEAATAFLRRALAEPPHGDRSGLLLELGTAEASAGLSGWLEHLQAAVEAAEGPAAVRAARVLASALNRAQRSAEAVDVLDRAASTLARDSELAPRLEAAAVVDGMNDPVTAPSMAIRAEALREWAARHPQAPPDVLAAAAFTSVLTNEPAAVGAELARRALREQERTPSPDDPAWSAALFARVALSLFWAERYAQVQPLLDNSIAEGRLTGDSGRLAVGLANRAWLALRRGDLRAAEGDALTALAATELPAPPIYRVLNGGVLVEALVEQGELIKAEHALALHEGQAEGGSLTAAVLRHARGRLRLEQGRIAEGLEDFLAVGARISAGLITCPDFLPWRSAASLAYLALGNREAAERVSQEEVELADAFGAPRALGVARRAAGLVAGGDRGELLLREALEALEHGEAALERARVLTDLGALLRRRNRRAEAREYLREALDAAHRLGANRLSTHAETELRATGARPRRVVLSGLDSLTASERRIAELASQDLTNREIAQTLFITSRTVEGHLTSVFRKLHLDSREELPAALARDAPVSV